MTGVCGWDKNSRTITVQPAYYTDQVVTNHVQALDKDIIGTSLARGMLENLRYRVTVAANGMEAWYLFLENPSRFDLIIADQTMPDVTGVSLAQKMLGVRKELPIILCTGYSEIMSAEKAQEVGICAFVMKSPW